MNPPLPEPGAPSDPAEVAGTVVWVALIAAWVLHQRWAAKNAAVSPSTAAELCRRCYQRAPEPFPSALERRPTLCSGCRRRARLLYAAFVGIFGSFAVALLGLTAFVLVVALWRGVKADDVGILALNGLFGGLFAALTRAAVVARRELV